MAVPLCLPQWASFGLVVVLWSALVGGVSAQTASLKVNIVYPAAGAFSGDSLTVVVTVSSTFEIKEVVARVEGRQGDLLFSPNAYSDKYGSHPGWTGTLSLSGLARGEKTLSVTATDAFINSAAAQAAFVYDRKPTLTVTGPLTNTVARPQVRIAATCTDDDPAGCALAVYVSRGVERVPIASGQDRLDQELSLMAYDGSNVTLTFQSTDSAGQTAAWEVPVSVESSQRLSEVESVTGAIWEAQPDRILFLEPQADRGVLKIRQRATGVEMVVIDQTGRYPQYGYLSPKGAIFMEQSGNVLTALISEERDGVLIDLGFPNSARSLVVKGNYAIWSNAKTLFLRDLVAGTNTTVASGAGNWMNDVDFSGGVVYWGDGYNIYRYRAGTVTPLTRDTALWNVYPLTDGNAVVYRKQDSCCGQQRYGLFLHDGVHEIELAPLTLRSEPSQGADYQINGGWVAFTRLGTGGQLQVWTRSPAGQETQVTYFGDSSRISALAPNGQVMFLHGRRYLTAGGQQAMDVNSSLGNPFWQQNAWWITLGRSLFKVNTATTPTMGDLFFTQSGQFGFRVSAADGQRVVVQASQDLDRWTDLQTGTVNGGSILFKDNDSGVLGHRFYRVVTP
ncbi:MAG: hypothetical protein AB9869_11465 [Verrucomicrobiia bacterium]